MTPSRNAQFVVEITKYLKMHSVYLTNLIHIMALVKHLIAFSKILSLLFDCTSSIWTVFLFPILSTSWVDGCMNMSMYVYNTITLCYIDKYIHCQVSDHVLSHFQ